MAEYGLPAIAVARPLVEDKKPSEVTNVHHFLQQFVRQVVEWQIRARWTNVQRPELFAALARNPCTGKLNSKILCAFDKPLRDLNHFRPRHGQAQRQPQVCG